MAKRCQTLLFLCVPFLCVAGCSPSAGNPKVPAGATSSGGKHAVIETDRGTIEIEFLEADAPKAIENFRCWPSTATTMA